MHGVEVRRSAERFTTVAPARPDAAEGWATTRHSFSFGEHYDPENVGFGPLLALNDETVRAGKGYPEHLHRDVEIVTWVVSGTLRHADDAYPDQDSVVTIGTGWLQCLSAGAGVTHAEGATEDAAVRFVQTWVRPDAAGGSPSWAAGGFAEASLASTWVPVASGSEPAAVSLRSRGTTLWVTRLAAGEARPLPGAPAAYVLLVRGSVEVDGIGSLDEGDALEMTVPAPLALRAREAAEILVWTFA